MTRATRAMRASAYAALVALLALAGPEFAAAQTHRDPKALEVADAVEKAVAPDGGWQKVGGLRFTFVVMKDGAAAAQYEHTWDVRTGRYRIDWKDNQDGGQRCVIFDTGTKTGRAWQQLMPAMLAKPADGTPQVAVPGSVPIWFEVQQFRTKTMVKTGYGRFINDSYWLLMPLKMKDPGVNLDYAGEVKRDGETYDVVKMTFDHVGLTPGDAYWVYVNRKTHLVDLWEYILEGEAAPTPAPAAAQASKDKTAAPAQEGGGKEKVPAPERTVWLWKEWQSFGPLKLSTLRAQPGKAEPGPTTSIQFKSVEVLSELPAGAFDPPK